MHRKPFIFHHNSHLKHFKYIYTIIVSVIVAKKKKQQQTENLNRLLLC